MATSAIPGRVLAKKGARDPEFGWGKNFMVVQKGKRPTLLFLRMRIDPKKKLERRRRAIRKKRENFGFRRRAAVLPCKKGKGVSYFHVAC